MEVIGLMSMTSKMRPRARDPLAAERSAATAPERGAAAGGNAAPREASASALDEELALYFNAARGNGRLGMKRLRGAFFWTA